MAAKDTDMTIEEFRKYYRNNKGVISSVKAYDAAARSWVSEDVLFTKPGTYTLIVVKFKNKSFLRVNVKPSLIVTYSHKRYSSASTWKAMGVNLTYEEKEFLSNVSDKDMPLNDLIKSIEASGFEGKETLLKKLRKDTGRI